MNIGSKTAVRGVFGVILVVSLVGLGYSYATAATESDTGYGTDQRVGPRGNITVISTDSNKWLGSASDGPRANAELVAFAPNGSPLYYDDSHTRYWDVDPLPASGSEDGAVVEHLYSDHLDASQCPDFLDKEYWRTHDYANSVSWDQWKRYAQAHAEEEAVCTRNGIARVNLRTGETTEIYSAVTPGKHSSRWHDGDRINSTHYAVADIYLDRVFVVDTETGTISWQWNAQTEYTPEESGGEPVVDWTHVNDVEVLPDGRLMVDLRNHDSVVFLDPTEPEGQALQEGWTLGEPGNHSLLYEQHNPDYIPRENGGPAVVIGDSENNRVVEYHRQNGAWSRTWEWEDARSQWPRDADRLPNGHTLITDSNGDRVFEVDRSGDIVWSVDIAFPYEAERFPYDESTGGPSTTADASPSNKGGPVEQLVLNGKDLVAGPIFSATQYVLPQWVGLVEFGGVVVVALSLLSWGAIEAWWLSLPLRERLRHRFDQ